MAKIQDGWIHIPHTKDSCTVDVETVELIMCRSCIYHNKGKNESDEWNRCDLHKINTDDDYFCSWGSKECSLRDLEKDDKRGVEE